MRLRRKKPAPQVRGREPRFTDRQVSPAFSYYNNRPEESIGRRGTDRKVGNPTAVRQRNLGRPLLNQLPFWALMALVLVCLFKLLVLSTHPKIVIVGSSEASKAYLQPTKVYAAAAHKILAGSITNYTKPTANVNGTARQLERQFPELQTVSVTLPLMGNRPIVYLLVAQPSLVLRTTHGDYALNTSGLVLAKLSSIPPSVPLVTDQSGVIPKPGKQFLPGTAVGFIQTISYQFGAAHLPVAGYVLPVANPYEIDVRPEGKPYMIRFNAQEDALQQSGAAIATLQHLGSTQPHEYLDVRVPDRAYYK